MHQTLCGISKFIERDIDMLLAEELRVNAEFCQWMMERAAVPDEVILPAISVNVSVVEDGSEADVVATFETRRGGHHRVFIENKIDAPPMPQQLERYLRRATGEVRRGAIGSFSVIFFTPSTYSLRSVPEGIHQISFEEAAEALLSRPDSLRSRYRASLLTKALPLRTPALRDAQVAASDPYIKEWWDNVYAMLDREFPSFFRHKTRYPRSVYFAPENPGQAPYLRVDFKGHKGEVDLAFKDVPLADLKTLLASMDSPPGRLVANGKSSAIRIAGLAPFVISEGFEIIDTKVRVAYQAAHDLLTFWKKHREVFDQLTSRQ